jgi:hypothetical protein
MAFQDPMISQEIAFINSNFSVLIPAIKMLQGAGLPMAEVAAILLEVRNKLDAALGPVGEAVRLKFDQVLKKNHGFTKIRDIGQVISGHKVPDLDLAPI